MAGETAVRADELAALEFFAGCSPEALAPLAGQLRPLTAAPGQVLMQEGEPARWFLLIESGRAHVVHRGTNKVDTTLDVAPGVIVGELALLRNLPRSATVIAAERLTGWAGDKDAFTTMVAVPGLMDQLVRTARQRIAAFITPIPVRMRDGSELYLRPVLPGDNAGTRMRLVEFSRETMYRRFQTMQYPPDALMTYLFEVDYADHFVWVMTDGADGPLVADARFVRSVDDPALAEVAFIVADDYQGRGIGTLLFGALAVTAECDGVQRFSARVLADNHPMRTMLDNLGAHWSRVEPGVVSTVFDVPQPSKLGVGRALARQIGDVARQVIRVVG